MPKLGEKKGRRKSEKKKQDSKCKKGGKGKDEGIESSRERQRLCVYMCE